MSILRIIGIVILLGGAYLAYEGYQRKDSLIGKTDSGLASLAKKIDGQSDTPQHVWKMGGGFALMAVGVALVLKKNK